MSGSSETDLSTYQVGITIPCLAEYVSIARLAILGVAGRMSFSYDEVEDIRLAVGEACTHAIERAAAHWMDKDLGGHPHPVTSLKIDCEITDNTLTIDVCDSIPTQTPVAPDADEEEAFEEAGIDRQHLSALLMEILVDEVQVRSRPDGTCVRLIKRAAQL